MNDQTRFVIAQQVGRVRRRLFMQVLLESLIVAWALGFLLSTFWFLARPFAFQSAGDEVRWGVPIGMLVITTLGGLALGWLRRPNLIASSLALDEKFGLKQRVTTLLTLSAEQLDSPAGRALAHDVKQHLASLRVSGEFPLRISWRRLLMPAGAIVLAVVACLLDPVLGNFQFRSVVSANPTPKATLVDTSKAQEEMDKLKKNLAERNQENLPKSAELQELEKDFEKLVNQPIEKSEEKIKERVNEMRKLEDRMKDRLDGVRKEAEKAEMLKKHLKALGADNKEEALKEGPAKDFEDALLKGDFKSAKAALEKLAKDLKNEKLDPMKQKDLAKDFKKLNDKLQKMMKDGDLREKLKKDFKEGKLTEEQLERELDAVQQLQDLNDIVDDLQDNLAKSDGKKAGENLDKAMKRFGEIELTDQEIQDILRDQDELGNAMRALLDALEGEEEGEEGDGMGGGRRPGGRRAIDPNDPDSKISPERTRVQVDAKGQQRVTGYARGGNFSKVPAKDVGGAFRQAAQDGPEALDRQRIPDDAADIARDYFKKLGNQK